MARVPGEPFQGARDGAEGAQVERGAASRDRMGATFELMQALRRIIPGFDRAPERLDSRKTGWKGVAVLVAFALVKPEVEAMDFLDRKSVV